MNSLPVSFYESVTLRMYEVSVYRCCELSGLFGLVSADVRDKNYRTCVCFCNGELQPKASFKSLFHDYSKVFYRSKYCVGCNVAFNTDDHREHPLSSTDARAIAAWNNHGSLDLIFTRPNLPEDVEESLGALRMVYSLRFSAKTREYCARVLEMFVRRRTLRDVYLEEIDDEEKLLPLILDLLRQEQMFHLFLPMVGGHMSKSIIACWRANPDDFRGKELGTRMTESDPYFQKALRNGTIIKCTKAEKKYLDTYFPLRGSRTSQKLLVSRNRKGGVIYWQIRDYIKSLLLIFA